MSAEDTADVHRIERALTSGEPDRTADALRELANRRRHAERIAVAFPGEEIVDVTGPGSNEELLLAYCELVRDFGAFTPQLSWTDSIRIVVEVMLRHGGGQSAHDVAMSIKTDGLDPVNAAREAIWSIWRVGLPNLQAREAAARFVSYLLDGKAEIRETVLYALEPWVGHEEFLYVLHHILPELTDEERSALLEQES